MTMLNMMITNNEYGNFDYDHEKLHMYHMVFASFQLDSTIIHVWQSLHLALLCKV